MTEFEKELVRFVSGYLDAGVSAEDYVKAFSQRLLDSIGQKSKGEEWTEEDDKMREQSVLYLLNAKDSAASQCRPHIHRCMEWLKTLPKQSKPKMRFPHEKDIVDKVFGAGNLDGWEYDEAKALVALAKEELLKDIKPKVSEELEEAAKAYADDTNPTDSFYDAFKEGAIWQKEQMMKEAVKGQVIDDGGDFKLIVPALHTILKNTEDGEMFKLIFIKEEGK